MFILVLPIIVSSLYSSRNPRTALLRNHASLKTCKLLTATPSFPSLLAPIRLHWMPTTGLDPGLIASRWLPARRCCFIPTCQAHRGEMHGRTKQRSPKPGGGQQICRPSMHREQWNTSGTQTPSSPNPAVHLSPGQQTRSIPPQLCPNREQNSDCARIEREVPPNLAAAVR